MYISHHKVPHLNERKRQGPCNKLREPVSCPTIVTTKDRTSSGWMALNVVNLDLNISGEPEEMGFWMRSKLCGWGLSGCLRNDPHYASYGCLSICISFSSRVLWHCRLGLWKRGKYYIDDNYIIHNMIATCILPYNITTASTRWLTCPISDWNGLQNGSSWRGRRRNGWHRNNS